MLLAVQVLLLVFVMASMAACVVTDSGRLPREAEPPEADAREWMPLRTVVNVRGIQVESKLCARCNIYRRPRSAHCSTCNACVGTILHRCGESASGRQRKESNSPFCGAGQAHGGRRPAERFDHRTAWHEWD